MNVRDVLTSIRPRQLVYDLLGLDRTRAHEILRGKPMPTKMLARFYRCVLVPAFGRERALEIVSASLADWHREVDGVPQEVLAQVVPLITAASAAQAVTGHVASEQNTAA